MYDAGARRDDTHVLERALPPLEELIALLIALELAFHVVLEGAKKPVAIDLHGMVDHEIGRLERIDAARVAAHLGELIAHRSEVDHGGDAGEILKQDARRSEGDLRAGFGAGIPVGDRLDVAARDGLAVFVAE